MSTKGHELRKRCEKKFGVDKFSDTFFENFLVSSENDFSQAEKLIDHYFRYKKYYSEYFQAGDTKEDHFRSFCSSIFSIYMPKLSSQGYRVFVERVTDDENLFDIFKILKYFCMQTDIRFSESGPDNGDVILFDCNKINLLKFVAFVPYFIKSLTLLLKAYPIRLRLLVIINTGRLAALSINLCKMLFLRNYKSTIHIYPDGREHFLKHVGANVLPKDYNGELSTMEQLRDDWMQKLDAYHRWFKEINHQISNSLAEGFREDISFGINFCLKRLQID